MDKNDKQHLWLSYRDQHLEAFLMSLSDDDFITSAANLASVRTVLANASDHKTAFNSLKTMIRADKIKKLSGRFRAYVHRLKNDKKSLFIQGNTYARLRQLTHEYGAETIDEMFEYLLSPKYNRMTEEAILQLSQEAEQVASRVEAKKRANDLLSRLTARDRQLYAAMQQMTFFEGWIRAKKSTSRAANAMETAYDEYLSDVGTK